MHPKLTISFWQRGLPGLLCMALGIGVVIAFRNSSLWSEQLKHLVVPAATLLAVGGGNLVGSYVWQKPWSAMRNELIASATIAGTMLLLQ